MPPFRMPPGPRVAAARLASLTLAAALPACDDQGPAVPAHIVVAPNLPRVPMGGTRQLTATLVDADGRATDGEPVAYQANDPSILTVDGDGLLTSVGPLGSSVVSVASGDLTTEVEARVVVGPSTLYASPAELELRPGQQARIYVVLTDENGDSIPTPDVLFRLTSPETARVNADGYVTAVAPGSALVTVSAAGQHRDILVRVSEP